MNLNEDADETLKEPGTKLYSDSTFYMLFKRNKRKTSVLYAFHEHSDITQCPVSSGWILVGLRKKINLLIWPKPSLVQ